MSAETTEIYRNFYISPDRKMGYSGFDRAGNWMLSETSKEKIKQVIDNIIKNERHE